MTQSRRDLFHLSRLIAASLPPDVIQTDSDPLLVSVRGSLGAGKKIIADAMREYLLGSTALSGITGRPGYDEYWQGQIRGQDVELSYIDAAWLDGYSDDYNLASFAPHMVRQYFMWQREKGGIAFVHNDRSIEIEDKARLDIWMEQDGKENVDAPDRLPDSPLAAKFHQAKLENPDNEWLRYVEIKVTDKRLLDSPKFRDAMQKMKKRYGGPQ